MIDKLLRILENKENALDAVALVPGPNFRHITGGQFFLMERPFVIFISKFHKPVAVVPVLEVSNFTKLNFDADIIEWQDNDGFQHAFDKALKILGDNFALGSDYDGAITPKDISKIGNLCLYLKDKGYSKKLIEKIFYKNWISFLDKNLVS